MAVAFVCCLALTLFHLFLPTSDPEDNPNESWWKMKRSTKGIGGSLRRIGGLGEIKRSAIIPGETIISPRSIEIVDLHTPRVMVVESNNTRAVVPTNVAVAAGGSEHSKTKAGVPILTAATISPVVVGKGTRKPQAVVPSEIA